MPSRPLSGGPELRVSFRLNGSWVSVDVEPGEILLDTLRLRLGIRSVKRGCERGECGVCTVLLNGEPIVSCLLLTAQVDSMEITTVEGLRSDPLFKDLAEEFARRFSIQCGYCTPAILLTTYAYIRKVYEGKRMASVEEIVKAIEGNLCRCGTYPRVVRAVVNTLSRLTTAP
jgi:carbon-monoxide dehydrogenase small subunit